MITNYDLIKIEISNKKRKELESLTKVYKKLKQKINCNTKSNKLSIETEFGLCNFFYNTGNYDDALEQIENIIKLQPNNTKAIYCKVIIQKSSGKLEQAIASCERISGIDCYNIDAVCTKGMLLSEMTRREEAIECFDKVLSINPSYVLALYHKGMLLSEMTRREEAIE
ncbi:MAG: tetratricopeptide repeat protein, partial [Nitrosotalea sp.]